MNDDTPQQKLTDEQLAEAHPPELLEHGFTTEGAITAISAARRRIVERDAQAAQAAADDSDTSSDAQLPAAFGAALSVIGRSRQVIDETLERLEVAAQTSGSDPRSCETAVRSLVENLGQALIGAGRDRGPVIVGGVDVGGLLARDVGEQEVRAVLELAPSRSVELGTAEVLDALAEGRRMQERLAAENGGTDASE